MNTPNWKMDEPQHVLAFYLPQFHPIPENDEWWGKGFTEWRNVAKAKPLFDGHNQPHLPADLGFYDLRVEDTRIAQADLAREYGITGFCYYHYWFNGRRLLERPLEEVLASGKPDFPFCICWANENWTRRWDGEDAHVLVRQEYSAKDDRKHIRDLFRIFEDKRYIRIQGKPLLLVYRTENLPQPAVTADIWREEAAKAGIGDLFLCRVESIGKVHPHHIGFDAAVEFAPDWSCMGPKIKLNADLAANNVTLYDDLMERMLNKPIPDYRWFRCVTPSWDNFARRREGANIFVNADPDKYFRWLDAILAQATQTSPDVRITFVNAWNEWAEGNHLEPCNKWGRSYLEATRRAVENNSWQQLSRLAERYEAVRASGSTPTIRMNLESSEMNDSRLRLAGWAFIDDGYGAEGSDVIVRITAGTETRLVRTFRKKRPDVTSYFKNGLNYDDSGFEAVIDVNSETVAGIDLIIARSDEMAIRSDIRL